MEPTAIISIAAFLIAVFSVMWQMNINRMRDELLEAIRENRVAIQSLDSRVGAVERGQARLEGFNERLSEVEREQARLAGANRILGDAIRRQSHTREGD